MKAYVSQRKVKLCRYCGTRERPKFMRHCGSPECRRAMNHVLLIRKKNALVEVIELPQRVRPIEAGPLWRQHLAELAAFYQRQERRLKEAGYHPNQVSGHTADKVLAAFQD